MELGGEGGIGGGGGGLDLDFGGKGVDAVFGGGWWLFHFVWVCWGVVVWLFGRFVGCRLLD